MSLMRSSRYIAHSRTFSPAPPFYLEEAEIQGGALELYNLPRLLLLVG